MKKFAGVCLIMVLLGCYGCEYLQSYVDMARDKGMSDEYQSALNAWTRTQTVHSQFETKASVTATLKSRAFINAYLKENGRIHQVPHEEMQKRREAQTGLAADFTEFLFFAYTPDRDQNDFDKRNSIWKVFIIDEKGNRIEPVEIRRIDKVTADLEFFYPYIRKYYGYLYSLKFKPVAGIETDRGVPPRKPFKLVMASVLAKMELDW